MKLSIIGTGYVGLVTGTCVVDLGNKVICADNDEKKIQALENGKIPIYEPGLEELVRRNSKEDRLEFTTDIGRAVKSSDIIFICVGTPSREDGKADLTGIEKVSRVIAEHIDSYKLIVEKSTVPVETGEWVKSTINNFKKNGAEFDVASNPEFLREGSAVDDFLDPDKVVFGTMAGDDRSLDRLHAVFAPLFERSDAAVVETGTREAMMIKYANNAFLAAKVSLINELGNVCKEYGVDAYEVAEAIGLDDRIGGKFLRSGVGWGGSCFPKDVAALVAAARERGYEPELLQAAVNVNDRQPGRLLSLLDRHVDVAGERVAVLGLAFKPNTDDVRNSRAIPIVEGLRDRGADVVAYDPVAAENMRDHFPDLDCAPSAADALDGASAAVVVTDWPEFAELDEEFDRMATPVVVDGRRIIERRDGIVYEGLTW